jgi:hypothetical protein
MSEQENIKAALETTLSNPKVSSVVAAITGTSGAAGLMSDIHLLLSSISLAIGCLVGVYTLRILHIKGKILKRMERDGESLKD